MQVTKRKGLEVSTIDKSTCRYVVHGKKNQVSTNSHNRLSVVGTQKTTENKEGASEYHVLKDELKQTKIRLRALYLLIVILFLITASSLGLAAYCFSSIKSSSGVEYRLNTINSEVVSQRTFINNLESQFNAEVAYQMTFISNLESQLNTTNAEVASQRTLISNLESQFNTTSAEVTSQRIFINSQLNEIDSDISTVRSSVTNLQKSAYFD